VIIIDWREGHAVDIWANTSTDGTPEKTYWRLVKVEGRLSNQPEVRPCAGSLADRLNKERGRYTGSMGNSDGTPKEGHVNVARPGGRAERIEGSGISVPVADTMKTDRTHFGMACITSLLSSESWNTTDVRVGTCRKK
jgi:hypothetical protein